MWELRQERMWSAPVIELSRNTLTTVPGGERAAQDRSFNMEAPLAFDIRGPMVEERNKVPRRL